MGTEGIPPMSAEDAKEFDLDGAWYAMKRDLIAYAKRLEEIICDQALGFVQDLLKVERERDELRERCTKLETDLAVANIKLTAIGKALAIDAKGESDEEMPDRDFRAGT